MVALANVYRYNGKELDEATGLYDYGARYYDPAIARWTGVDPLAETTPYATPYNYVENMLTQAIDPDGLSCVGCGPNGEDYTPHEGSYIIGGGAGNDGDPPFCSDFQNAAEPVVRASRPRNTVSNGILAGPKSVNSISI